MWPFGKKKDKERTPTAEELQVQDFAAGFLPEEFTLVAVTGPEGLDSKKQEGDVLYTVTLPLSAWMDEDDGVVQQQPASLTALADDRLLGYLRHCLPGNFIIKVCVRPAREGGRFQMVGMPEPGMDPELKAILDEQVKPIIYEAEGFATFTLSRAAGWFQTEIDFQDGRVLLTFDAGQDQERCAQTAQAAVQQLEQYDTSARTLAAQRLLEQVREQAEDDSIEEEAFAAGLSLDSIQVDEKGGVTLFYACDLLWTSSVQVICANGKAVLASIEE